jgi:hypothetical protein
MFMTKSGNLGSGTVGRGRPRAGLEHRMAVMLRFRPHSRARWQVQAARMLLLPSTPSFLSHLAFFRPPARRAHRHCTAESSTTHSSVTTASFPDWLGQTLRHYLLYALHVLAEPVGSQVERKGSFLLHRHARSSAHLAVHRGRGNAVLLYSPRGLFRVPWVG